MQTAGMVARDVNQPVPRDAKYNLSQQPASTTPPAANRELDASGRQIGAARLGNHVPKWVILPAQFSQGWVVSQQNSNNVRVRFCHNYFNNKRLYEYTDLVFSLAQRLLHLHRATSRFRGEPRPGLTGLGVCRLGDGNAWENETLPGVAGLPGADAERVDRPSRFERCRLAHSLPPMLRPACPGWTSRSRPFFCYQLRAACSVCPLM